MILAIFRILKFHSAETTCLHRPCTMTRVACITVTFSGAVQAVSRYTSSENKYIFHVIKRSTWLERNLANSDLAEFSISDAKSIEIFIFPFALDVIPDLPRISTREIFTNKLSDRNISGYIEITLRYRYEIFQSDRSKTGEFWRFRVHIIEWRVISGYRSGY